MPVELHFPYACIIDNGAFLRMTCEVGLSLDMTACKQIITCASTAQTDACAIPEELFLHAMQRPGLIIKHAELSCCHRGGSVAGQPVGQWVQTS